MARDGIGDIVTTQQLETTMSSQLRWKARCRMTNYALSGSWPDDTCFGIARALMPISSARTPEIQTAIIERTARKQLTGKVVITRHICGRHAYTVQAGDFAIHGPVLDGCLLAAVAIQRGLWPGHELIRADDLLACVDAPKIPTVSPTMAPFVHCIYQDADANVYRTLAARIEAMGVPVSARDRAMAGTREDDYAVVSMDAAAYVLIICRSPWSPSGRVASEVDHAIKGGHGARVVPVLPEGGGRECVPYGARRFMGYEGDAGVERLLEYIRGEFHASKQ